MRIRGIGNSLRSQGSWPWVRSVDRPVACALTLLPSLVPHCVHGLDLILLWVQKGHAKAADTGAELGRGCSSLPPGEPPALGTTAGEQEDSRVLSPILSPASCETWRAPACLTEALSENGPQVSGAVLVLGMQQGAELDLVAWHLWSRSRLLVTSVMLVVSGDLGQVPVLRGHKVACTS